MVLTIFSLRLPNERGRHLFMSSSVPENSSLKTSEYPAAAGGSVPWQLPITRMTARDLQRWEGLRKMISTVTP